MDHSITSVTSYFGPLTRMSTVLTLMGIILLAVLLISTVARAVYNLYFHPLHPFPGPRLWIAFPLLRHIAAIRGLLDFEIRKFHDSYGSVVRYSDRELSFIHEQAWKDIYGQGHRKLPKKIKLPPSMTPDIITANDADHARFRKALAPGFSERALRDQEPLMTVYVDLLVEKLKGFATSGAPVDMVKWYNLATFDIIGDLAFGASFNGLRDMEIHDWIRMIFKNVKMISWITTAREYPILMKLFLLLSPKSLRKARADHEAYSRGTVMKRVNDQSRHGRGDFMDAMMRHRGGKDGLTDKELVSNSSILILAGSETSATLLSGATYWLSKSPDVLRRVTREVREAFVYETDITFLNATQRLPYMLACLEEALRLYPPVPNGLQRTTPDGPPSEIAGFQVPSGTMVSVNQSAAYWSARNFHESRRYVPERWLPQAATDPSSPFYNDNRAVFQPFSVGPNNCIGRNLAYNEMRIILARVLWNFDIVLSPESENWADQKTFFLWEKPELFCVMKPRSV